MKYKIDNIENYTETKGWLCGHFFPRESLSHTSDLEVKFDTLKPGHTKEEHWHPRGMEILVVVSGKMEFQIDNKKHILEKGDFLLTKENVKETLLKVHEPTNIVIIKTPSVKNNVLFSAGE